MEWILAALLGLTPKESLRFQHVEKQLYDTSCGFSTVSNALGRFYGVPVDEQDLVASHHFWAQGDTYRISLTNLATMFQEHGVLTRAVTMTKQELINNLEVFSPMVLHLALPVPHFTLVVCHQQGTFTILDSITGEKLVDEADLLATWSGTGLLLASRAHQVNQDRVRTLQIRSSLRSRLLGALRW